MGFRAVNGQLSIKWFIFCVIFVIFLVLYTPIWSDDNNPKNRGQTSPGFANLTPGENLKSATKAKYHKYFVHTSKCMIPYIDPFSEGAMKQYSPRTFIPCSNDSELVSFLYDVNLKRYLLHINEPVAHKLLNSTDKQFNCFYREILHGQEAETYDT